MEISRARENRLLVFHYIIKLLFPHVSLDKAEKIKCAIPITQLAPLQRAFGFTSRDGPHQTVQSDIKSNPYVRKAL